MSNNDSCIICFKTDNKYYKVRCKCNINICYYCVNNWVKKGKNECPQCRKSLMKNQKAKHLQQLYKNELSLNTKRKYNSYSFSLNPNQ